MTNPPPNQDCVHKAVELADGFQMSGSDNFSLPTGARLVRIGDCPQWVKDALAAQLVRQVDAITNLLVIVRFSRTDIWDVDDHRVLAKSSGSNDRAMNTIKAIVDSGVLE